MPYAITIRRRTVAALNVMRPELSSNNPLHGTAAGNPAGRMDATSKVSRSLAFDAEEGDVWVVCAEAAIEPARAASTAAEKNPATEKSLRRTMLETPVTSAKGVPVPTLHSCVTRFLIAAFGRKRQTKVRFGRSQSQILEVYERHSNDLKDTPSKAEWTFLDANRVSLRPLQHRVRDN